MDRYDRNGWIYKDGKKTCKWFQSIYSEQYGRTIKVWDPNLDIAAIEHRCKRIVERMRRFRGEYYRPVWNRLMAVKQAHANPTHKFTGDKKWWLYHASKHGVGFDWVDEPKDKINHALGQKFYELDNRFERYGGYVHMFESILAHLIEKKLREEYKPERAGTTMKLTINGLLFWYVSTQDRYCINWKKISWPYDAIDKIIEVEI